MSNDLRALARKLLNANIDDLTERERKVLAGIAEHKRISRNVNRVVDDASSFGERLADRVAAFGGSWTFIIIFGAVLLVWIVLNTVLKDLRGPAFDPFPFIFLNLILSMLAAIQAPVIMMSQNRQSDKDRTAAAHDYEVNLKAELEIMQLHEKLDDMRLSQLTAMFEQQSRQLEMIERLLASNPEDESGPRPA